MINFLIKCAIFSTLLVPFPLFAVDTAEEVLLLLVDKQKLTATLQTWPSLDQTPRNLMKFKIAIGKEQGDKQYEGDNKTPEGIYFINSFIDGKSLPEKYGPLALPINFPNDYDKDKGKTGHGIWLHGVADDSRIDKANVTEGCVAFYNADISLLKNWLHPKQSVVMITDNQENVNNSKILETIQNETIEWIERWKAKDLDGYISHYHSDFKNKGRRLKSYKRYKNRIFNRYSKMKIKISDLRIFAHKNYAISTFNQDFSGDKSYISNGRKVLYWYRDKDNKWKISHENYEDRRFRKMDVDQELVSKMFEQSPSKTKTQ